MRSKSWPPENSRVILRGDTTQLTSLQSTNNMADRTGSVHSCRKHTSAESPSSGTLFITTWDTLRGTCGSSTGGARTVRAESTFTTIGGPRLRGATHGLTTVGPKYGTT